MVQESFSIQSLSWVFTILVLIKVLAKRVRPYTIPCLQVTVVELRIVVCCFSVLMLQAIMAVKSAGTFPVMLIKLVTPPPPPSPQTKLNFEQNG